MEKVNLGEYVRIKTGKLDANASNINGKYPFFTCSNEPLRINDYSYDCECVLVAGNGDLNVKYYNGKFDAYQRTYIIEVKDKKLLNTKYLYYLINANIEQLRRNAIGGVIKYIKLGNLTNIKFELVEIKKQNYIIEELDKIQEIIDLRKKQIGELDELIKSQFVEMFGNLENNKWKIEKLDNVTFKITDGKHGGCKRKENSGYYFVGATEIYNDRINYEMANQITEEEFKKDYNRCDLKIDDFVIVNTGATIGKNAIVDDKICNNILLQKSVALIRVNKKYMLPIYLKYCYDCNPSLYSKGQGCARVNLLLSQIRNTIIPIPPIELQNQFEEFVKQINRQKIIIKKSLKETEELQESLMNKYFE